MNQVDLLNFVIAALVGSLTAYLAKGRGRSPVVWFFIGMFFGLIGLVALYLFPQVSPKGTEPIEPVKQAPPPILLPPDGWFYLNEKHEQFGPVALVELQTLYKGQKLNSESFIWREGMEGWKPLKALPTLQDYIST